MYTATFFSENSPAKAPVYIKGVFKKEKSNSTTNAISESNVIKEKAVVRHIFKIPAANKSIEGKYEYTIQHGDNKRLSRDGVLRVYNIKEPVDIPVRRLLGNWNKSHIGITLIVLNGQWCVEGEAYEPRIHKSERGILVALRLLLKFALA